jgi:hypothetical protein
VPYLGANIPILQSTGGRNGQGKAPHRESGQASRHLTARVVEQRFITSYNHSQAPSSFFP